MWEGTTSCPNYSNTANIRIPFTFYNNFDGTHNVRAIGNIWVRNFYLNFYNQPFKSIVNNSVTNGFIFSNNFKTVLDYKYNGNCDVSNQSTAPEAVIPVRGSKSFNINDYIFEVYGNCEVVLARYQGSPNIYTRNFYLGVRMIPQIPNFGYTSYQIPYNTGSIGIMYEQAVSVSAMRWANSRSSSTTNHTDLFQFRYN